MRMKHGKRWGRRRKGREGRNVLHSRGMMHATVKLGRQDHVAGVGGCAELRYGTAGCAGLTGDDEGSGKLPAFKRGFLLSGGDGGEV